MAAFDKLALAQRILQLFTILNYRCDSFDSSGSREFVSMSSVKIFKNEDAEDEEDNVKKSSLSPYVYACYQTENKNKT